MLHGPNGLRREFAGSSADTTPPTVTALLPIGMANDTLSNTRFSILTVTFSEALGSQHAFTWYPEQKIFAFPVSVWSGDWTSAFNGLMAFRVDTAADAERLWHWSVEGLELVTTRILATLKTRLIAYHGGDILCA